MAATLASPALGSSASGNPALGNPAFAGPVFANPGFARPAAPAVTRSEPHGVLGLGGLRLTRRGRVAVIVVALLVSLPLAGFGGRAVAGEPSRPIEVIVHTVAPGETLWAFARQIAAPGQDVRDVVADLVRLNELTSGSLQVGQAILIPKA